MVSDFDTVLRCPTCPGQTIRERVYVKVSTEPPPVTLWNVIAAIGAEGPAHCLSCGAMLRREAA